MDELNRIIEQLQLMNEDLRESNDKADQKEHYIRELQIKQLQESKDDSL
jgi:sensor histidine kinase YesM